MKKFSIIYFLAVAAFGFGIVGVASAEAAGVVSLTFDDGNASQYSTIRPLLLSKGQKGVFYVNSGLVGQASYMTWAQLTDLKKAGFEIAGHTSNHVELPTLSLSQMRTEINGDYSAFVARGITPTNFAAPFGAYDNISLSLVAKRYNSHRAFANQGLNFWPYNKYLLYVRYVTNQTSVDQAKAWVDEAQAQNGWLVLVFHEILTPVDPEDTYSWTIEQFTAFLDYLNSKQIVTKNIDEVLKDFTNLIPNSSFENGLASWITDNATSTVLNISSNGSYPTPKNSIRMAGTTNKPSHLFSPKVAIDSSKTYGVRTYIDSRNLTSGEIGFYVDEYDTNGNWTSGKWLGALYGKNVIDYSYVYTPSSSNVKSASVQIYMTAGTRGSVFLDNVELFAR